MRLTILLCVAASALAACGGDDSETTTTESPAPDSVPSGAVAIVAEVDDGTVTEEDFDAAMARGALAQGLQEPPAQTDPEYEAALETAMTELLNEIWIRGEAAERGITVTEIQIDQTGAQLAADNFASDQEFEDFTVEQQLCTEEELAAGEPLDCERVRARVRSQLLSEALQEEVLGTTEGTEQEELAAQFEEEFTTFWRERTLCAEDYTTDRCSNGPEPPVEAGGVLEGAAPGSPATP